MTPFVVAGLILVAGLFWRMQSPGAPLSPLAVRALALDAELRAGGMALSTDAPPPGLPPFARWVPAALPAGRLRFDAPGPRVPFPWRGAARASVDGAEAVVSAYGTGADESLLVVLAGDRPEVLGPLAGHMGSEWNRYDYQQRERRLMIWQRGGLIFALVTGRPFDEAGAWLPAPGLQPGEAERAGGPPGSDDPSRTQ